MYANNEELSTNWLLYSTHGRPDYTDLQVKTCDPAGNITHGLITEKSMYVKPSTSKSGFVVFKFTPALTGLWEVTLFIKGTAVNTNKIYISENDTLTTKHTISGVL